jgi:putative Ca2+/H+ antiporter (TMEM165/GDT1 family)
MVITDGLAIIIGKVPGKQLPEKAIKYGAATVFLVTVW